MTTIVPSTGLWCVIVSTSTATVARYATVSFCDVIYGRIMLPFFLLILVHSCASTSFPSPCVFCPSVSPSPSFSLLLPFSLPLSCSLPPLDKKQTLFFCFPSSPPFSFFLASPLLTCRLSLGNVQRLPFVLPSFLPPFLPSFLPSSHQHLIVCRLVADNPPLVSYYSLLPAPLHQQSQHDHHQHSNALAAPVARIPAYGQRKGWKPRKPEDFGDGGAYPEINSAQYPLDMGRKKKVRRIFHYASSPCSVFITRLALY